MTLSESRRPGVGVMSSGGFGRTAAGWSSLATSSESARTSSSPTMRAVSAGSFRGLRFCGIPPASARPISSGQLRLPPGARCRSRGNREIRGRANKRAGLRVPPAHAGVCLPPATAGACPTRCLVPAEVLRCCHRYKTEDIGHIRKRRPTISAEFGPTTAARSGEISLNVPSGPTFQIKRAGGASWSKAKVFGLGCSAWVLRLLRRGIPCSGRISSRTASALSGRGTASAAV